MLIISGGGGGGAAMGSIDGYVFTTVLPPTIQTVIKIRFNKCDM